MLSQPTQEQLDEMISYGRWNDSYAMAIFSGLLLLSGVPLLIKNSKSASMSGLAIASAVVIGIPVGLASGWLGFYCQDWLPIEWDVLVRVAVRWMAVLAPIGLLAGVLVILSHSQPKAGKLLSGGVVGAVMAALTFCLLVAVLFQTENSDAVLPASSSARLLLFVIAPLLIWTFVAYQQGGLEPRGDALPQSSEPEPVPPNGQAA